MKQSLPLYCKLPKQIITFYKERTEISIIRSEKLKLLENMKARCNTDNNKVTKYIFNRLMSDTRCLDKIIFVTKPDLRNHLIVEMFGSIYIQIHSPKLDEGINDIFSANDEPCETLKSFKKIIDDFSSIFVQIEEEEIVRELLFKPNEDVYFFRT